MSDVPITPIRPPLRCFHSRPGSALGICGELAHWMRIGPAGIAVGFFCDEHREKRDEPIAGATLFRRVRVAAVVDLAGASLVPRVAEVEALNRLRRAMSTAGALLNVLEVTSVTASYSPPAPPEQRKRANHRGQ